jgi:cytochrome d ubiquinol oxidase subunit I
MLAISWAGVAMMVRRRAGVDGLPVWMHWVLVPMAFSGWVATLAGWYTTEIGRQPWLVQGVLATEAAVSDVSAPMVLSTLIAYLAIYALLLVTYIGVIFHLARKAAKGDLDSSSDAPDATARAVEQVV